MSEILTPEQIAIEAQAAYRRGDYANAAQSFEAARQGHLLRSEEVFAAEMANNRCVALLRSGNPEAALQAVQGTPEIFEQAGDLKGKALALGNQASALEGLKRLEEAKQLYWQSAEILEAIGENDLRLYVMQSISALQLRTGQPFEAVATMRSGYEAIEKPSPKQRFLIRLLDTPMKVFADPK